MKRPLPMVPALVLVLACCQVWAASPSPTPAGSSLSGKRTMADRRFNPLSVHFKILSSRVEMARKKGEISAATEASLLDEIKALRAKYKVDDSSALKHMTKEQRKALHEDLKSESLKIQGARKIGRK